MALGVSSKDAEELRPLRVNAQAAFYFCGLCFLSVFARNFNNRFMFLQELPQADTHYRCASAR